MIIIFIIITISIIIIVIVITAIITIVIFMIILIITIPLLLLFFNFLFYFLFLRHTTPHRLAAIQRRISETSGDLKSAISSATLLRDKLSNYVDKIDRVTVDTVAVTISSETS